MAKCPKDYSRLEQFYCKVIDRYQNGCKGSVRGDEGAKMIQVKSWYNGWFTVDIDGALKWLSRLGIDENSIESRKEVARRRLKGITLEELLEERRKKNERDNDIG